MVFLIFFIVNVLLLYISFLSVVNELIIVIVL